VIETINGKELSIIKEGVKAFESMGKPIRWGVSGVPNHVYHDPECPGISSSKLGLIARSIKYFEYSIQHPISSAALGFGSALHDSILLPDLFKGDYVCGEKFDKRTKTGKEAFDNFSKQHEGKKILDPDDYQKILDMRESVMSNTACANLFSKGVPEVSYWWTDEESGFLCKCRTDWIREDLNLVIDIKTTTDSTKLGFAKSIAYWDYDRSAAFYLAGMKAIYGRDFNFAYIAIEKEPPYELGLFILGQRSIETGAVLYKRALQKYKDYTEKSDLDKALDEQDFITIDMPEWSHNADTRQ
jgi:exodeoxyribonuclease VIII